MRRRAEAEVNNAAQRTAGVGSRIVVRHVRPVRAVRRRVGIEDIARPLQPDPGVGISWDDAARQIVPTSGRSIKSIAHVAFNGIGTEASAIRRHNAIRRSRVVHDVPIAAVRVEGFAHHQTHLGPLGRMARADAANDRVEIVGLQLPGEVKAVGVAPNVAALGGDDVTAGAGDPNEAGISWINAGSADVRAIEADRIDRSAGTGGNGVATDILDSIDGDI